jgi:hypothetical protein
LHSGSIVARAECMLAIQPVRIFDLLHIELNAQARFLGHVNAAVYNAQRLFR